MSQEIRQRTNARARTDASTLAMMLAQIRACRVCTLPHAPRPVVRASRAARIAICGQAPGTRVHATGIPFNDPSGDRLRAWLGLDREVFYDEERIAIVPMGFCFPGQDENGSDLPPRAECAAIWHARLFAELPQIELKLLVGTYAQAWHLEDRVKDTMSATVRAWAEYLPDHLPLPHPSWRNNRWLKDNCWFAADLVPELQARVRVLL
jgi:uracil-DNA glycosylase